MTDTITNANRTEWAGRALEHFRSLTGTDREDSLGDLLCDLMHWSDASNFDFDAALCRARSHHGAEIPEAGELTETIAIKWHIDDVLEIRPDLTADQCRKVLTNVKVCHDAAVGVNWDVLETVADILFPEGGAK
jgi:hypothetical protein